MEKRKISVRARGRVALGDLARDVTSYEVTGEPGGELTLKPYCEVPVEDKRKIAALQGPRDISKVRPKVLDEEDL